MWVSFTWKYEGKGFRKGDFRRRWWFKKKKWSLMVIKKKKGVIADGDVKIRVVSDGNLKNWGSLKSCVPWYNPEGRLGMFDASPLSEISELLFDSTLLSPLLFFCLLPLLFLSSLFFLPTGPFFWLFSQKFFSIFHFEIGFFFIYSSCFAARRSKFVGNMCSMLPYGSGICCHAFT